MITGLLYTILGFIETIVALRFGLRLLGANPSSPFVNWIYEWSTPFVSPFAGIFGQDATVAGPGVAAVSVFDWTALIALIVFGLILAAISSMAIRRRRVIV